MADDGALDTYRYLRGGMPVLLVVLFAALIIEWSGASCAQGTISAYYFTAVHAVFIGCLCAIGAMLIVYKGRKPTEDILLNVAGVLAFVVAFVPTSAPDRLCGRSDPLIDVVEGAVLANVWALVIALAVARVALWVMYRRTNTTPQLQPDPGRCVAIVVLWAQRALLAAGLVALVFAKHWFVSNAHHIAAFTLFAAIIGTVFISALVVNEIQGSANPTRYQRIYLSVGVAMLVTLAVAVIVHFTMSDFKLLVLCVELVLLVEFACYWAVQTIERWNSPPAAPAEVLPEDPTLEAPVEAPSFRDEPRQWLLNNL